MKIIKQNAELISHDNKTPYQLVEIIGRTCYKSGDKITDDSAVKFVQMMATSKHYAMLEHAVIHLVIKPEIWFETSMLISNYNNENCKNIAKHANFTVLKNKTVISASFRVLLECIDCLGATKLGKAYQEVLSFAYPELFPYDKPAERNDIKIVSDDVIKAIAETMNNKDAFLMHHLTHTVLFTTDRGVSHEFVRHRPASFAQESTRYCCYVKERMGNEIVVIEPYFKEPTAAKQLIWENQCKSAEDAYFALVNEGCVAQEARGILPTDVKTDLVITAFEDEWQHIINLRYHGTTGAPHPKMKIAMECAYPLLTEASDSRLK